MNNNSNVTRRDFIRGTVGATIAASLIGVDWVYADDTKAKSVVTLVRDEKALDESMTVRIDVLEKMLDRVLTECAGKKKPAEAWLSLVKKDDIIGLISTPHLNPTHTELVDAVKNALIDAGVPDANIINPKGDPDKVKTCTALIALPALKAHWLTGIGTVIKNYIMFSGKPKNYHNEDSAKLGEIWNLPFVKGKTKLVLVDALHPLCDKGPQPDPRYKWGYKGLLAGTDPVAVETVCLKILNEKRHAMRGEPWPLSPPPICVEAADKIYKLGTSNWDNIRVQHFGWEKDILI